MNNTDNTNKLNTDNSLYSPCIDPVNNTCITDKGITIHDCILLDNGNIKGLTPEGIKALYIKSNNQWFFGRDIGKTNLISLRDRTVDERLQIIEKANESKRRNIEQKKTFNELCKTMLELQAPEKEFDEILGSDKDLLFDRSYGSLILAAMFKGAKEGSFKCAEFIRDTAGYKPKNEVELQADIMTEADKSLIDKALKTG